ncbi:ABC transporter substrate-binding protein [Caballeronia sp. LZ065]|uniref:ABC transporter substrate-binding protein n=1 Tax=Caballeronia sp. LZ065 TaxID=3038571 RepID=UPI00285660DA|nr:ABC transporter substrate-binding protein [Caballeronia sp. LZ065]MDR5782370.1 ABC transporter substrate-binding protein [Caballeronia sp. LZ065]
MPYRMTLSRTRRRLLCAAALGSALPVPSPAIARVFNGVGRMRILAPDRAATSTLLALGVQPVAGVDKSFYDAMGGQPPMPPGIADCGDPNEPNLELMLALRINQCVTVTTLPSARERIASIAPVLHLEIYNGETGAFERAAAGFRRAAALTGREPQATAYMSDVDALTERTAAALRAAGAPLRPAFLLTLNGGGRSMVVYGRNSMMFDVMRRLGLPNAWTRPTNTYGFAVTGVEALAEAPDADVIVVDFGAGTTAALAELAASPFWNRLPMVRRGRVFRIPLVDLYSSYPAAQPFLKGLQGLARRPEYRHV